MGHFLGHPVVSFAADAYRSAALLPSPQNCAFVELFGWGRFEGQLSKWIEWQWQWHGAKSLFARNFKFRYKIKGSSSLPTILKSHIIEIRDTFFWDTNLKRLCLGFWAVWTQALTGALYGPIHYFCPKRSLTWYLVGIDPKKVTHCASSRPWSKNVTHSAQC